MIILICKQVKCVKYWLDKGVEKECGNLRIKLEDEKDYVFYVVRRFKVFYKKVGVSVKKKNLCLILKFVFYNQYII